MPSVSVVLDAPDGRHGGKSPRQLPGASPLVARSLAFGVVDAVSKSLALAVVIVLARRLNATGFGDVVTAFALAAILSTLLDMGISLRLVAILVGNRETARDIVTRRYHFLGAWLVLAMGVAIVGPVRLVAVSVVAAVFMTAVPVGPLLTDGRPGLAAFALAGPNLIYLGIVGVMHHYSAVMAMALWALANALVLGGLWLLVDWLRPRLKARVGLWSVLRGGMPIAVFNLATTTYGRIDIVLVAVVSGSVMAGVYGTYYRVVLAAVGLASWSGGIAAKGLGDITRGRQELRRLLRFTAVVGLVTVIALLAALRPILHHVLKASANLPVVAFVALALLPLPLVMANPMIYFIVVRERQPQLSTVAVLIFGFAVVSYPLAIAATGVTGAAVTSLAIETAACCLFARLLRQMLREEQTC